MNPPVRGALGLTVALLSSPFMSAQSENFDHTMPGQLPANWLGTKTATGSPKWSVEKDPTAPSGGHVLKQSGAAAYPLCLKTDTKLQDGFVEVKFKPISGREDQAGGLVWRAKDADNYYITRANALEDNVTIYYTVNGRRTEKKRADLKVTPNSWHTLRVDFHGRHFVVTLDGRQALEWDDDTFPAAGMIGVWTKADSVTAFDDFNYGSP